MATTEQEKIYNDIMHYYVLADQLIKALEDGQEKLDENNFTVIEEMVICLEEHSDRLATTYVEYVKNGNAESALQPVRDCLSAISARIAECRNHFMMMHI